MSLTDQQKKQIIDTYYNIDTGGLNLNNVYTTLNKTISKAKIKAVLDTLEHKQIDQPKIKIDKKKYIQFTSSPNSYQADLMFLNDLSHSNKNVTSLLTIINVNSKKAYVYPLKNKTEKSVSEAFEKFIKSIDTKSLVTIYTDSGTELINKKLANIFNNNNIHHIPINKKDNPNGTQIIERFNRTLRERINQYLLAYKTKTYIDKLDQIVNNYNNTHHSTLPNDIKPNEINQLDEAIIHTNIADQNKEHINQLHNELKIGDKVRVLKKKDMFHKGGKYNYSKSPYIIQSYDGNGFIVKNMNNNNKSKKVYAYELKKISEVIHNPFIKKTDNAIKSQDKRFKENKKKDKIKKILKADGVYKNNIINTKLRSDRVYNTRIKK